MAGTWTCRKCRGPVPAPARVCATCLSPQETSATCDRCYEPFTYQRCGGGRPRDLCDDCRSPHPAPIIRGTIEVFDIGIASVGYRASATWTYRQRAVDGSVTFTSRLRWDSPRSAADYAELLFPRTPVSILIEPEPKE